jgi:hypothetical protein
VKHGLGMSIALLVCTTADAADPLRATAAHSATLPTSAAKPAALNLRIGDVRKYMTPNDYLAAITAPDADKTTIVVEGARELAPLQSLQPIPAGFPPATLWWAARHPLKSWRVLLPDLNAPAPGPTYDKVPPPIFRWGP